MRVLAIPAGHTYVRQLPPVPGCDEATAPAVVHLADPPVPEELNPRPGQWWPHQGLEVSWLRQRADDFDLVHLHFGFEHLTVEQARAFVAVLRELGKPLVMTVHDLTNPHLSDQTSYDRLLDVLVPAADELFTLTPTAARSVRQRWDRAATIVAHPHVLPLERIRDRPATPPDAAVIVGVHLGAVRAATATVELLEPLLRAVRRLSTGRRAVRLRVDLRPGAETAELADWLTRRGDEVEVERLAWQDDDALAAGLESLDIAVLPYRWGTHSGWAEACRDAGVHVVAPDHGAYADQHPSAIYRLADEAATERSLHAALSACLAAPPVDRAALAASRATDRERTAQLHARRYAALVEPRVDVVIPWFRDQRALDRLLSALEQQTFPVDRMTVLVGDDGSPASPVIGERPFHVVVRRHRRDGFRAGAARNLAAGAGSAPVLLFLDADMAPTATYVQRMYDAARDTRGLVVGRRMHALLDPDTPWSSPDGEDVPAGAQLLPQPAWLDEGYAATHGLRDADERSYRFVISAVAGIDRELFERIGGFEESFRAYGGEDWDLAHRAWIAGADLRHVSDAVAWHDGEEQGRRDVAAGRAERKNAELRALAQLIPDPRLRHGSLAWEHPQVAVLLREVSSEAALIACAASVFASDDVALIIPPDVTVPPELAGDRRVRSTYRRGRTPWEIRLSTPCVLTRTVPAIIGAGQAIYRHPDLEARVVDVRAAHRHTPSRWVDDLPPWVLPRSLDHPIDLEAEWGWRR